MEAGERGKEEQQTQMPWIPTTPLKPVQARPVPICGSGERNQLNQTNFLGASSCCNSTHDSPADRVSACIESALSAEINSRIRDWEEPAAAGTNIAGENSGTCSQMLGKPISRWVNTGCTELLALADAASAAHFTATHPNNGVKSPSILTSQSQLNRDLVANLSSLVTHHDLSPQQTQTETNHVNPQEPKGTASVAFSSKTISQLAPHTPAKAMRAECRQLAGTQIYMEERAEGEMNNVPELDNSGVSQNQDMSDFVIDISFAAVSTPLKENHNPHRGENEVIDLNKTPQQKARRKKHRPKVISEGKPKRTSRPVTPKPAQSEKPTVKRKYVRRKELDKTSTTPPSEVTEQSTESIILESTKKSCRRALNFEISEQPIDEKSTGKENGETMHLGEGVSQPEGIQAPSKSLPKNDSPGAKPNANSVKRNRKRKSQVILCPNDANSNNDGILTAGLEMDGSKRKQSTTLEHTDTSSVNLIGARYNGLQAYQGVCIQFPNIQKKRRSGKGQISRISTLTELAAWTQEDARAHTYASSSPSWIFGSEYNAAQVPVTFEATVHNKPQMFQHILSLTQNQTRPTKRRSKVSTQVNHSTKQLGNDDKQVFQNAEKPTCMDALVAEMRASLKKKKRTKKISTLVNSAYSSTNEMQLYQNLALVKSLDAKQEAAWKDVPIMEALGEQFRHIDINRDRDFACEEQNALVLYNVPIQEQNALFHAGGGTMIPFSSSFDPIKKQHPRPKVDLDDETNRVWELLMLNINNDGIDGNDEDKAKWWEEERRVFRGRADSFVARMRLVQGDRRFSPWKGSVVDSVVGVFLTQNVSDHLSSSAFVSLAAKFPLKSSGNCKRHSEEGTSLVVKKPEVLIEEPEENTEWDEMILNQSIYDENSVTIDIIEHSEEKAINRNSTGTTPEEGQEKSDYGGAGKALDDVASSQCSVISSQISGDFSVDQNPEKPWSCTDSNSEVEELSSTAKYNLFDNSTSFSKLLQLQLASSTMLHEDTSQRIRSSDNLKHTAYGQSTGMKNGYQTENLVKSDAIQGCLEASMSRSSNIALKETHSSGVLEVHCCDHFKTEASSSGLSNNKDENDMIKSSSQITESANQAATAHSQSTLSLLHLEEQNHKMQQNTLCISGQTQEQKTKELDSSNHNDAVTNETKEMSASTIKSKGKRLGRKKEDFKWDSLRVEAEARAGKRERTVNNMDSVDWDAVRCADVNEIAEAIKERGMNNMLAERIKNFLNRLVQDHGSIDLEWLRDVQPDQAKEFLLSVRGLGLKSVECVRLLTLHHLAFPVDTNVGRIAVRLGWVPLQPLPESLQLHLLELYPVLESIQKYLWPRLCKLDQNTLYELHYQMITFGKVFCTKSKPNCNACPMRGECRHFASAFASARLALPGPEERSIISTARDDATDQNPSVIINPLPLPLPEYAKQPEEIEQTEVIRQLEAKSGINICQPIIEEPATPEPECAQISENDMEDIFREDPTEIPTIRLNFEEFTLNLQNFMQHNMELQEGEMSQALVALDPEAASIPMPKLKNVSRLRTEHCVYELPDDHALLEGWDKLEPDDPCRYLLAIWTPGETANSIQPPESKCSSQECGNLCNEKECFSCNTIREANMQIVRGTILIPCRTAMRGRFPLNGTYFQVNEVFADHDSSLNPIHVPRSSIWKLRRRTVYFGTSIPTIFKGLSTQEIQHCFWRGHVCVRGFDRKTRAPRPLMARLHFPASKLAKNKEKKDGNQTLSSPEI